MHEVKGHVNFVAVNEMKKSPYSLSVANWIEMAIKL